ncbi:MAG TPA: histidine phosphatase family protein [Acidimicrobiia bacterium]|nr:histidine phosphatase family protein [Acidimicrobiia bacterium]HWW46173.1 histidine phosphatase family protein [Acidimicrobiia bacterium]
MIILVRHGETEANRAGLLLGRADPPLTARGVRQAAALARALARVSTPTLITSPLTRAVQTATTIGDATGTTPVVEPRLTELDYGAWDERPLVELPADVAAQWRADPTFAPPGGESLVALRERVAPCTAELLDRAQDDTVIAVSHVSPIKATILVALGLPDELAWRLRLDLASISRLAAGPTGPVLVTYNQSVARG